MLPLGLLVLAFVTNFLYVRTAGQSPRRDAVLLIVSGGLFMFTGVSLLFWDPFSGGGILAGGAHYGWHDGAARVAFDVFKALPAALWFFFGYAYVEGTRYTARARALSRRHQSG